jgi:hypothetical protein
LSDATINRLVSAASALPTPVTELHVQHLGGAVARAPAAESAFAHRDAQFFVNLIGQASEKAHFEAMRAWIRALYGHLSIDALGGRMPNFSDRDDQDAIARFGEENARRLRDLRECYDPSALFAGMRHRNAGGATDT